MLNRIAAGAGSTIASSSGSVSVTLDRVLDHDWQSLGSILEPHLAAWPSASPVGDWLREGVALRVRRAPADYAALLLLKLGEEPLALEPLRALGAAGKELAAQLDAWLGSSSTGEPTPLSRRQLFDALGSMPSMPLRAKAQGYTAALLAAAKATVQSNTAPAANEVGAAALSAIGAVTTPRRLPAVTLAPLAESLAYGGSAVLGLIEAHVRENPASPLAFSLREMGEWPGRFPGESLGDVLVLLSRFRDRLDPKRIDGAALVRTFGPIGEQLLEKLAVLAQVPRPKEANLITLGQMVAQLGRRLERHQAKALADELVRNPRLIPKSNPILDRLLPHIPKDALAGQGLLAVQHLLPSVCTLIEACIQRGMKAKDIHVSATPYNCNPLVASYLELCGVHVQRSMSFGVEARGFEDIRVRELNRFLTSSLQNDPPPNGWKILDDGGMLHAVLAGTKESRLLSQEEQLQLRALCRQHLPHMRSGTEQTTRGLTEIRKVALPFPVFTVANQRGKTEGEGQIIGWILAQSMLRELVQAGRADQAQELLNISAGVVGLSAARQLTRLGFKVKVYDLSAEKRAKARAEGFEVIDELPKDLNAFDAVLSSTGRRALHLKSLADYRGLVGSGSSASVEFDGQMLGPLGGQLNRAHPLNFIGNGYERLTQEQIGATIALLFLGISAPTDGKGAGEHDVDHALEDRVMDAWFELGGDSMPSLERTRAAGIPRPDELAPTATHDEWMTYLANLPRAVSPRPNSTGFVQGVYFFEAEDGRVRVVDTAQGLSFVAEGLDRVPERVAPGGYPKEQYPLLLFEPKSKPYATVRVAHVEGGSLRLSPEYAVEREVSHYVKRDADARSSQAQFGFLFERDDQYVVFWPGRFDMPEVMPKPFGQETIGVMQSSKRIYCTERRSGAVRILGEPWPLGDPVAQPILNIERMLRAPPYDDLLAVGVCASGRPAVGLLTTRGWHAYELPEGAIVQDVYWPGDYYHFRVTYTLPGEAVEPENLKEKDFAPIDPRYATGPLFSATTESSGASVEPRG